MRWLLVVLCLAGCEKKPTPEGTGAVRQRAAEEVIKKTAAEAAAKNKEFDQAFDKAMADKRATDAARPPIYVNAKTLIRAYKANEIAADREYRSRRVVVFGIVAEISKRLGSPTVALGKGIDRVSAEFSKDSEDYLAKWTIGSEALIDCVCAGAGAFTGVRLNRCGGMYTEDIDRARSEHPEIFR